jgi:hypothetical protein
VPTISLTPSPKRTLYAAARTTYPWTLATLPRRADCPSLLNSRNLLSQQIADASLDFAHLDARHDYKSVRQDLADWWPKVKPEGILAGHDYVDGRICTSDNGVKRAVDKFFAARGLRARKTLLEGSANSWLVVKR